MPGPSLEVADIFRAHGAAWRVANAGHISLNQFKVMSAIERCRTEPNRVYRRDFSSNYAARVTVSKLL
jgi:hypothetical protein